MNVESHWAIQYENLFSSYFFLFFFLFLQISAVRAVVPNKSNNEIVLVLQHFENCVDKAVQAFLEGMKMLLLDFKNVNYGPQSLLKKNDRSYMISPNN